jgi:hypothetical protein
MKSALGVRGNGQGHLQKRNKEERTTRYNCRGTANVRRKVRPVVRYPGQGFGLAMRV